MIPMPPKKDDGFKTVRLKENLIAQVDAFLKTDEAKQLRITSRADFIAKATEERLENLRPRFRHINTFEDHALIADWDRRDFVSVYFKEDGTPYCEYHQAADCECARFALEVPKVVELYKRKGWRRPLVIIP
jgi:hypothetical protein